jgi:predicted  nucleic acid-binding Zn-ribbon protein
VLWEAESGEEMFNLVGHKGGISAITWRSDSAMFASASEDGTVKLWNPNDGSALRSIPAHKGGVLSARFTHDGRIVSCGRDNKVQIWTTAGKSVRSLPFTGDLPNRVTFSHDGSKVIASDWTGAVFVWDAKTGGKLGELDAVPPSLAQRVAEGADRLAKFQATLDDANTAQAKAKGDLKSAQTRLENAKKSLADARARLTATGGEIIRASQQLADDAENAAAKAALAKAKDRVAALEKKIADLPKEIAAATKRTTVLAKNVAEAKLAVEDAQARLISAKTSLVRWQSALQKARTKVHGERVTVQF